MPPTRASSRSADLRSPLAPLTSNDGPQRPTTTPSHGASRSSCPTVSPAGRYRVVVNNYMASGGDGLSGFTEGTDITDKGIIDLDALVDWVAKGQTPQTPDRVTVIG